MAELTIRLAVDPDTGKKNITIAYHSDLDALPMEHEDEHRRLVKRLIEGGVLGADEVGEVIVEREESAERVAIATQDESMDQKRSVAHEA